MNWLRERFPGVAVYLDPRMALLGALGFSSGLPLLLVFTTLTVWLTEAGVDRTTIGIFAAVSTPYSFKFVWAPLIDLLRVPFLGRALGRRRSWMLLTQLGLIGAIAALGFTRPDEAPQWTAVAAVAVAFLSASQDIVIDAYRVDLLEQDEQAAGAAVAVFGYRLGMFVAGAGALFAAGWVGRTGALLRPAAIRDAVFALPGFEPAQLPRLLEVVASEAWRATYVALAAAMLVGVAATMLAREPDAQRDTTQIASAPEGRRGIWRASFFDSVFARVAIWPLVRTFGDFFDRYGRAIGGILTLVLLFKLADALAATLRNPFLIELGYSKEEIAAIAQTYGMVASIAGSFIGGALVKRMGISASLVWASVLMLVSNLAFAVLAEQGASVWGLTAVITVENLTGGFGTTTLVAWLSGLCNRDYSATQYAVLSSLSSVGRTVISTSSGWVATELGWTGFFVYTALAGLPALALLWHMRRYGWGTPRTAS